MTYFLSVLVSYAVSLYLVSMCWNNLNGRCKDTFLPYPLPNPYKSIPCVTLW